MRFSSGVGPLQEDIDRLTERRLELRPSLYGSAGLSPQGHQTGVNHVRPRVDRQNRFVLFGLSGTAQHLQQPLPQDDVRLDQDTLSLAVEKHGPIAVECDQSVARFPGSRSCGCIVRIERYGHGDGKDKPQAGKVQHCSRSHATRS